jgi:sugar transferase (PEP-CTERM system associated)
MFGHYWQLGLVLLWILESTVIFGCCVLAFRWFGGADAGTLWLQAFVLATSVMVAAIAMGLFSRRLRDRTVGVVLRIGVSVTAGALLGGLLLYISPDHRPTWTEILGFVAIGLFSLTIVRLVTHGLIDEDILKRRILVYGSGNNAARILALRRRNDQRGFKVVGFIASASEDRMIPEDKLLSRDVPMVTTAADLEIDEIVMAMDDRRQQFPLKDLLDCRLAGIEVIELASFLERETGKVYLDILIPSWMIFGAGFRRDVLRRYTEAAFDLAASFALLLIALPVMAITVLAIKMEEGISAPVLYGQPRVGYGGRVFRVLKFRSMRVDAEKDGRARWATANDDRVTRVGRFIRKVRIDELPQLFNVLAGRMSFVGPRPERPEFVKELNEKIPYYDVRHAVKPGITGWAQLCYPYGASEQDATEKLQYDLYYVKNHSLVFDILILLQTVEVILFGKGAR